MNFIKNYAQQFITLIVATLSGSLIFAAPAVQPQPPATAAKSLGAAKSEPSKALHFKPPPAEVIPFTAEKSAKLPQKTIPVQPVKKRIWNLQNADILAVIPEVAKITHRNFIVDPRVSGRINVVSTKPMTPNEIYQVFLSSLQTLGYDVVPVTKDTYRIVPATDAKYGAPLVEGKGEGDNQVVVQVVPITNVSASELTPIIQPLLQPASTISAYAPSNSIIIAGHEDNVKRIIKIIHKLDEEHSSRIKIVPLRHADSEKIVSMLQTLQSNDKSQGRVSNVSYAADTGTNSVLVSGVPSKLIEAQALIRRLDVGTNTSGTQVIRLNYLDATKFATTLSKIISGTAAQATRGASSQKATVEAYKSSNSILVNASGEQMQSIRQIIKNLDIEPQQVIVQAIIAQVDSGFMNKLGVTWGTMPPGTTQAIVNSLNGNATGQSQQLSDLISQGYGDGVGTINIESSVMDFNILLHALASDTQANILSTPSVMVTNNEDALLSNGKDISVIQSSTVGMNAQDSTDQNNSSLVPIQSYGDKKVDLTLKVTPQISPNNMIRLKIEQKDDSLEPNTSTFQPTTDTSDIKTNVMVESGKILVLGGLIKDNKSQGLKKVPILGDIPILGRLFQYRDKEAERKSLMVFIHPIIVSRRNADKISTRRYEYMRNEELNSLAGISNKSRRPLLPAVRQAKRVTLPAPFAAGG